MDWKKVTWKGLRSLFAGAAVVGLYAAGEFALGALDTQEELAAIGAPAIVIPILLGLGSAARNWLKHRKA